MSVIQPYESTYESESEYDDGNNCIFKQIVSHCASKKGVLHFNLINTNKIISAWERYDDATELVGKKQLMIILSYTNLTLDCAYRDIR